jgi:hypothetical protein
MLCLLTRSNIGYLEKMTGLGKMSGVTPFYLLHFLFLPASLCFIFSLYFFSGFRYVFLYPFSNIGYANFYWDRFRNANIDEVFACLTDVPQDVRKAIGSS